MVSDRFRAPAVAAALVAMLAVTGLALSSIYSGDLMPRLLLGAAAGSVALSLAVRRLPAWTAAPVSVLALAGYTVAVVYLSARSGGISGGLRDLALDALRNGIPRLLTALIPIEPQPDTVIVAVLATWLAGLAGAEIALRGRRVLLGYTPVVALYAGVLYVVGPNAQPALWQPLAFAGCAAAGLAASAGRTAGAEPIGVEPAGAAPAGAAPASIGPGAGPAGSPLRRGQYTALRLRVAVGALAGLAAVVALTAALGPTVARRVETNPSDPRRYVTPPQLDALDENPLVRMSGWALNPDQHLFDVQLSGNPADETRIRLAVLSDYDGVTWRVGASYRSAGRVLGGPDDAGGREVEQKITLADLDGRLLPAVATPRRVEGVRVAYDPASGTLALPEGLRPGLAYTVDSRQPRLDVNLLPAADVPSGPAVARFLGLGNAPPPPELLRLANQLAEGQAGPYQRASAIEQFISEHYQLVGDATSGHAYPNLTFFLFGPRNGGGQRGTSEQFAASFAVLGRLLALPTRVVVGFRARPGTGTVRGADALAWPEVLFTGIGWVPFDPLPEPNTQPKPVEDDFRPKPNPSNPPPSLAPTPVVSGTPVAQPKGAGPAPTRGVRVPVTTVLLAAAAGLGTTMVGYLVLVPLLRRAQRRRRLYRGDPPARVAGAWREVHDALRLSGQPAPEHLTATELAEHAAVAVSRHAHVHRRGTVRLPPPSIVDLAGLANLVTYAAETAGEADARLAAAQALAYVEELRARRPRRHRLLWTLDPRPLRWARKRPPATDDGPDDGPDDRQDGDAES
jgi:hypothetical protein